MVKLKMFAAPVIILGMKHFDLKAEDYTEQIRAMFAVAVAFTMLICNILSRKINSAAETDKKVSVTTKVPGKDEETNEMTYQEYDLSEVSKVVKQTVMGALVVGFMHFYLGYVQPLMLQGVMLPLTIMEHQLSMIHFFGMAPVGDLKRPWAEASPFAGLQDAKRQLDEAKGVTSKEDLQKKRGGDSDAGKANKHRVRKDK